MINPAQNLSRATKSVAPQILSQLDVRVPRALRVTNPEAFQQDTQGLRFPLIIREDRKHSAPTCLVKKRRSTERSPLEPFLLALLPPNSSMFVTLTMACIESIATLPREITVSRDI